MGISPKITPWLKQLGHEVEHIASIDPRAQDSEILALALSRDAVVLTADKDFGDLLASTRGSKPSVILFRLKASPPNEIERRLAPVLQEFMAELELGCLITIALGRPRLRLLPIWRKLV